MKRSLHYWKQAMAALAVVLGASSAHAVSYSGSLVLRTQAEVDAAAVYTEVTGSLTITGSDINDLSPLAGITSIGSYLSIRDNPALTAVADAFPALTGMGGGIYVYYNPNLVSLSGFDALLQTGDNIDFWYNNSLTTVSGFGVLHTAGWSLEFGGNPVLTTVPLFESLQTISSSLFILDNPALESITGFKALQHVAWSFQIVGNSSLADLCGFYDYFSANNPYTGGGAFNIEDNSASLPNPTLIQDVLNAGPCPAPAPAPLRVSHAAGQARLEWDQLPGTDYFVEWTADFQAWNVIAVGQVGTWTDPDPCAGDRFYRVSW